MPRSISSDWRCAEMSWPPNCNVVAACLSTSPSKMGTTDVSPAPASATSPVVRPDAKRLRDATLPRQMEGTWNVSNNISAHRFLSAASVSIDSQSMMEGMCFPVPTSFIMAPHSVSSCSQFRTTPRCTGCEDFELISLP